MLASKKATIDGVTVECTQLPVLRQCSLFAKLGKILAPIGGDIESLMGEDIAALAPVLEVIDSMGIEPMLLEILASTTVNTGSKVYTLCDADSVNAAFEGKIGTLLKVAKFTLEVNFADFFGDAGKPSDAPPSPAKSRSTSTRMSLRRGQPGGSSPKSV